MYVHKTMTIYAGSLRRNTSFSLINYGTVHMLHFPYYYQFLRVMRKFQVFKIVGLPLFSTFLTVSFLPM